MIINNYKENWKKQCIYLLRNTIDNKIYIGSTNNLYKRINNHKSMSKSRKCMEISRVINNIGFENFILEILEIVENYNDLRTLERFYREKYKVDDHIIGYNYHFSNQTNTIKQAVKCITTNIIYESISLAVKETNNYARNIRKCCNGELHSSGKTIAGQKLIWEYV